MQAKESEQEPVEVFADFGVGARVAVSASREGEASADGLIDEEEVRVAVPAVGVDADAVAFESEGPHLEEEAVHGRAARAAVEPDDQRSRSGSAFGFEEPVEDLRVGLPVDVEVAGVVGGAEGLAVESRQTEHPMLLRGRGLPGLCGECPGRAKREVEVLQPGRGAGQPHG